MTDTATRYDVTRDELAEVLDGTPRYRVDQVWQGLYEHCTEPSEWTNVPKAMRADLAGEPLAAVEHAVRGRVAQAGLDVSDADIAALSRRIASDTED